VLKKDIRTKDKHKFSTPWEELFIIVDVATPGAYVLAEVDGGMLPKYMECRPATQVLCVMFLYD
jgi:hypothetical protein